MVKSVFRDTHYPAQTTQQGFTCASSRRARIANDISEGAPRNFASRTIDLARARLASVVANRIVVAVAHTPLNAAVELTKRRIRCIERWTYFLCCCCRSSHSGSSSIIRCHGAALAVRNLSYIFSTLVRLLTQYSHWEPLSQYC